MASNSLNTAEVQPSNPREALAATPVASVLPAATSIFPGLGLKIEAYRRYNYAVNTSGSDFIYKYREYAITITMQPCGVQYTDATGTLDTAANIIAVFRTWLIAEVESGRHDVATARQLVAIYNHTNPSTNTSFAVNFQAILDACPATENSYDVDQLRSECATAFGWATP